MTSVDIYLSQFSGEAASRLMLMREIILAGGENIEEGMAYGMPAYKLCKKPLVYFAGFKNHIGFYATPTGHESFKEELSQFKHGKGSVQFPFSQPLPIELIKRIVAFRVEENLENYG